jgi:hypothetical protein
VVWESRQAQLLIQKPVPGGIEKREGVKKNIPEQATFKRYFLSNSGSFQSLLYIYSHFT